MMPETVEPKPGKPPPNGHCGKCGQPWDSHRFFQDGKPLKKAICPEGT
jgi:hypothetical protein